jgi:hypothetical protein
MPTPYSIDGRLMTALDAHGMPVAEFAKTAALEGVRGASKTVLNESFRDVRPLKNEVAERCWALWGEIAAMCQKAEPLRLDLSDGLKVHEWLKAFRDEHIFVLVISELAGNSKS